MQRKKRCRKELGGHRWQREEAPILSGPHASGARSQGMPVSELDQAPPLPLLAAAWVGEAEGSWAKTFTSDLILKKICNFNDKNFSELNILSPPKESSEKELKAIGNSRKAQGDQRANM